MVEPAGDDAEVAKRLAEIPAWPQMIHAMRSGGDGPPFTDLLDQYPNSRYAPYLRLMIGRAKIFAREDRVRAREMLERFVIDYGDDAKFAILVSHARVSLAEVELRNGNFAEALAIAESLLQDPSNPHRFFAERLAQAAREERDDITWFGPLGRSG